ncbi:MAG: alpha/beta hydrolase [Bacilli bacterium]|nr:alpha/beta hydrolase [Bacilli bacterium]MBR6137780.1 alpha/beta hydrolase [Bacilli bacterium]
MKQNEFELEEKYKLYRTVKELLHPTISKRNISNYKIVVDENKLLLRVFYPKKVSNINDVIIFIPGEGDITDCEGLYSDISANISKELDKMVISIDYEKQVSNYEELLDKIYETVAYIYKELREGNIGINNITLMGDSTGANILLNIIEKMNKDMIIVGQMVLFYPVLSGEYKGKTKYLSIKENTSVNYNLIPKLNEYYKNTSKDVFPLAVNKKINYPRTLLLSGNVDPLIDEAKDFASKNENINLEILDFAYHGFLNTKDKEIIREYLKSLKNFMNNE